MGKRDFPHTQLPDRNHVILEATGYVFRGTMEIIVNWEEGIRLQFAKHPAQLLFNAINGMEEIPAVHP